MIVPEPHLLPIFKALADANRLRIIGLLVRRSYTVEQLAALLSVGASTVSHHLCKLTQIGLVSARAEGYYSVYHLEPEALQTLGRQLLAVEDLEQLAQGVDRQAYDQRVLASFILPDGSLKQIPAQRKKREVVLRHILGSIRPGREYSEQELNRILARFHEDTATLRRELVGAGWMKREHNVYWRGGGDSSWSVWGSGSLKS